MNVTITRKTRWPREADSLSTMECHIVRLDEQLDMKCRRDF